MRRGLTAFRMILAEPRRRMSTSASPRAPGRAGERRHRRDDHPAPADGPGAQGRPAQARRDGRPGARIPAHRRHQHAEPAERRPRAGGALRAGLVGGGSTTTGRSRKWHAPPSGVSCTWRTRRPWRRPTSTIAASTPARRSQRGTAALITPARSTCSAGSSPPAAEGSPASLLRGLSAPGGTDAPALLRPASAREPAAAPLGARRRDRRPCRP